MKTFIVDDSVVVRERLGALLSELEAVELVGQADNAAAAIEAIRRLKPDVVILDIHLPGGNGFQILNTIKQQADCPLVIMLTTFPYPQYRQKCAEAGADYFFDKSTEFNRLPDLLRWLQHSVGDGVH